MEADEEGFAENSVAEIGLAPPADGAAALEFPLAAVADAATVAIDLTAWRGRHAPLRRHFSARLLGF